MFPISTSNVHRFVFALYVGTLLCFSACSRPNEQTRESGEHQAGKPQIESIHLALGNPSGATADPGDRSNFLLIKQTFAMSYNDNRGTANWVAWKTTGEDLGDSIPRPDFRPDPDLPDGFRRINWADYTGSGYDRGHLVPSADRFGDVAANAETFLMTNIVPQEGGLNRFPWEKLESYARTLARRNYDVYQIAGVYGEKERLRAKVAVPTNCWKILLVLPAGFALSDVDENTRVIAVDMPNIEGVRSDRWQKYRTTVRDIEQKTGYDFLSALPPELREILETRGGDR